MCYRDRETRNKNTKLLLDEAEQLLDQITFSPASEGSDPLLKSVLPFTVSPLTVTMIQSYDALTVTMILLNI